MTGRAAGGPDPGTGTPTRTTGTREAAGALIAVLAAGLALRLIIAQLIPGSGFGADLGLFRFWATDLAQNGLYGFYDRDFYHDYTPGYLYVLWLIGQLDTIIPGDIGDLIKIPAILADLAVAYLCWSMVREVGGSGRVALIAAAIVVLNPITWFDSVVWGQVDSFGVVFLLLGLRELWRDRPERAAIFTVLAAIIKPQLGILVPLVAVVTIRRALAPEGGYGDDGPPLQGRTTLGLERSIRGPVRIVTTGLAGLVTAIVLSAPFGLSFPGLVGQVFATAGGYPYVSVNAYNPWALVTVDGNGIAANGQWVCDFPVVATTPDDPVCNQAFSVGPVPAVFVGMVLLLAAIVTVSLIVARRPDRRTILVGLAVLALAFFVVPTRVHERYLFPLFILGAILAAVSVRWRVAYVALSAATLANMYVVLTDPFYNNPSISDWLGIADAIREPQGVTVIAMVHLAGFVWSVLQLRDRALDRLADEIDASHAARDTPVSGWQAPADDGVAGPPVPWEPAPSPPPRSPPSRAPPHTPTAVPTWTQRPSLAEAGLWGWFRNRLSERPVRPDRSRALQGEAGGRLDLLDLWLVVVIVAGILGLRVWRLAEPYQMHFDEVYHARTATEFLQHWRYGISHDIYEWTHPHMAKYAIAGGIVAWGDDRVSATSSLGVPVRDAAIEPRYDDPAQGARTGDRLWVATGSELRAYDLATRAPVGTVPWPGAVALAIDATGHLLVIGDSAGGIATLDLATVDLARDGEADLPVPIALATVDEEISRLHPTDDGSSVVAMTASGRVVMLDLVTGGVQGEVSVDGPQAMADAGTSPVVVATVGEVADPAAAATAVADILAVDAAAVEARLSEADERAVVGVIGSADERTAIDEAIADGSLAGFAVEDRPRVAIADADGLIFVAPAAGQEVATLPLEGGAHGLAFVEGIDDPKVYVAAGDADAPTVISVIVGGETAAKDGPAVQRTIDMPAAVTAVAYDDPSQQIHVLGRTPDGDGATIYVIEPHANAVYADARLPFEPKAWAMDANGLYPSTDRQQLLVFGSDGAAASVEIGKHAFAWRLPGVIAGAIMAGLIYLLARILFRRREVAVGAAALVFLDGMLFVQSRIAMNDAFVGVAILAAYTIFATLWTGAWRWRGAFWLAMPAIGLLLGLALASKWVAAYAIGALGILVLARSALGRLVLIVGMIGVTTVLGYLAISVPEGSTDGPNLTFMLIMIGLTLVATIAAVLHPVAWSPDEIRFAIGGPAAAGAAVALVSLALGAADASVRVGGVAITPLRLSLLLMLLSILTGLALWLAGRLGFGPLAPRPGPDDPVRLLDPPSPPPAGWLRPGWGLGIPAAWIVVCLIGLPVAVYVASYIPWALLENHQLFPGWPPGNTGQTLTDLTGQMYSYHNNLSSPHAASSPWWAWPFDLKPVWFYQESFAGETAAAVYDAGNLASWWLAIPAMGFVAWQAFKRRSLGLALIAIAFACQWIPWARIDRAAFQYHYYTGLPFLLMGLAYFLAELWHGASRRTWLLARLAAAAAIVAPAAMWLLHRPLCGFVRVEAAVEGSRACPTYIPDFVLTGRTAILAVVAVIAAVVVIRQLTQLEPADDSGSRSGRSFVGGLTRGFGPLVVTGLIAVVALVIVTQIPESGEAMVRLTGVGVEPIALLVSLPLLAVAAFVATARDARRFVLGTFVAIAATFIVWYPNLSALPIPAALVNSYQGVLPTYLYPFQFPVSTIDRTGPSPPLLAAGPAVLLVALAIACLVIGYSVWVWRLAAAERRAFDSQGDGTEGLTATGGEA